MFNLVLNTTLKQTIFESKIQKIPGYDESGTKNSIAYGLCPYGWIGNVCRGNVRWAPSWLSLIYISLCIKYSYNVNVKRVASMKYFFVGSGVLVSEGQLKIKPKKACKLFSALCLLIEHTYLQTSNWKVQVYLGKVGDKKQHFQSPWAISVKANIYGFS